MAAILTDSDSVMATSFTPDVSKIDIKISETGVNLKEANDIVRRLGNKRWGKQSDDLTAIIGLFQMGPRTGNTVFTADYARGLAEVRRRAISASRPAIARTRPAAG